MNIQDSENFEIKFITVIPKSFSSCRYLINDSLKNNVKTYDKFKIWIKTLVDIQIQKKVNDILKEFRPFIIDIENQKVIELEIDNKELTKEDIIGYQTDIKSITNHKDNFEDKLNKISKNKINDNLFTEFKNKND